MTQNKPRTLSPDTCCEIDEHIDAIEKLTDAIKDYTFILCGVPALIKEDAVGIKAHAEAIIKIIDAATADDSEG